MNDTGPFVIWTGGLESDAGLTQQSLARTKPKYITQTSNANSRSPHCRHGSKSQSLPARVRRQRRVSRRLLPLSLLLLCSPTMTSALHHMRQPVVHWVNKRDSELPLRITNNCKEDLYPAILTQSGTGPAEGGFHLASGDRKLQSVSADWRGRVWARTNCTFNPDGSVPASGQGGAACTTGDCGQFLACQGAGLPPATLAEFTMSSHTNQAFYDVSLVDGYNVPMGIISLGTTNTTNANLTDIPPNLTNPVCIGTAALLAPIGDTSDETFGTNSTYPLPLEQSLTNTFVRDWCPFPLLLLPPKKPGDGVYPYPDDNIQRPAFSPCLSACAKWNSPEYCCTGSHDTPSSCKPSYYSTQAKKVCPDAYSYAYDDQTSTFIIPQGGGFEVVFCPSGRSSNILAVFGDQLRQLAQTGNVTNEIRGLAQNVTYIELKSDATTTIMDPAASVMALVVLLVWICFGDMWL